MFLFGQYGSGGCGPIDRVGVGRGDLELRSAGGDRAS